MPVALTIRDVPDDVRDALTLDAREHGQSLQAYLLDLLQREAGFRRNREVIALARRDLGRRGGSRADASDIVEAIHQAREERDEQIMRAVLRSDEPT
jgi:plasmid stability protein